MGGVTLFALLKCLRSVSFCGWNLHWNRASHSDRNALCSGVSASDAGAAGAAAAAVGDSGAVGGDKDEEDNGDPDMVGTESFQQTTFLLKTCFLVFSDVLFFGSRVTFTDFCFSFFSPSAFFIFCRDISKNLM